MEPKNREFDAIIVGSGPSGETVAKGLSARENNLEWGCTKKSFPEEL
jgi:choline dehydrogenase-like flavoprotein